MISGVAAAAMRSSMTKRGSVRSTRRCDAAKVMWQQRRCQSGRVAHHKGAGGVRAAPRESNEAPGLFWAKCGAPPVVKSADKTGSRLHVSVSRSLDTRRCTRSRKSAHKQTHGCSLRTLTRYVCDPPTRRALNRAFRGDFQHSQTQRLPPPRNTCCHCGCASASMAA